MMRAPDTLLPSTDEFVADLKAGAEQITDVLSQKLSVSAPKSDGEAQILEAMRYSALGGGKRLRPLLTLYGARLLGVPEAQALSVGCAIEAVHCYSLVHDDLPAMDDDDLRRGRPTTHIEYDEATAILAGDALQTVAFEWLASEESHPKGEVRAELISGLAKSAGPFGMIGGQMIDLMAEGRPLTLDEISHLQKLKTGALISFSCEASAILASAPPDMRSALCHYGEALGALFQIVDDLLDASGDEAAVGKRVGKDDTRGKATFLGALGVEAATEKAEALAIEADQALSAFGEKARPLRRVVHFVLTRNM